MDCFLKQPPYNVRIERTAGYPKYFLFDLEYIKSFARFQGDMMNPGVHGYLPYSRTWFQFAAYYKARASEKRNLRVSLFQMHEQTFRTAEEYVVYHSNNRIVDLRKLVRCLK